MIFLFIDIYILIIFIGIIRLRKQKNWESLFNDYEFKESLNKEIQEQYWKKATELNEKLFVWIFLMLQFPLFGILKQLWYYMIFMIIGLILIIIWYVRKWIQLKNEFQEKEIKKDKL